MKQIIICPYARPLRGEHSTRVNPKNYPFFPELITLMRKEGYFVTQVGGTGEAKLVCDDYKLGLPMKQLKELLLATTGWVAVDNFFGHFASYYGKRGITIWGQSDPIIYGYPQNFNLLKSRGWLRDDQYGLWESVPFLKEAFIEPEYVLEKVKLL